MQANLKACILLAACLMLCLLSLIREANSLFMNRNVKARDLTKIKMSSMPGMGNQMRTFASYSIYKGKGAVSMKPIPPTFKTVSQGSRIIAREGAMFFEFAPSGNGPREYDWSKKETFSLSATECGDVLGIDSETQLEFLHDPNMGGMGAGKVTKRMRWAPTQDKNGFFLSLAVMHKAADAMQSPDASSYSIPVTWGEVEVIRSIMQYSIPYLLGFDQLFSTSSDMAGGAAGGNAGMGGMNAAPAAAGGGANRAYGQAGNNYNGGGGGSYY